VFFPIKLFREVGMLNEKNHHTMDYELWGELLLAGATFIPVPQLIGKFRIYEGQKISDRYRMTISLVQCANKLIDECSEWPNKKKKIYRKKLSGYKLHFYYGHIRSKIGIRRRIKRILSGIKKSER
jgi:hypothetical protein